MSRQPVVQGYAPSKTGKSRIPVHTERLGDRCRCYTCRNRRWQTPERRAEMSARMKRQYANGTRARQHDINEKRVEHWRPEEDALVRELAPDHDLLTIAQTLTERFGQSRTDNAVKHRCKALGILRMDIRPFTASEVGRIFGGISRETVRQRFVLSGLMPGTLRRGGPHGMRMFSVGELERLVREHPEAYDAATIRHPSLRALAEAVTRGRRLLPTTEVERLTGVGHRTLAGWYVAGRVPTARKVHGVRPGATGAWLIEAGDLVTVRAIRDGRSDACRERAEGRRDAASGRYGSRAS